MAETHQRQGTGDKLALRSFLEDDEIRLRENTVAQRISLREQSNVQLTA